VVVVTFDAGFVVVATLFFCFVRVKRDPVMGIEALAWISIVGWFFGRKSGFF
jgi:hypothetical protein